MKKEFLLSCLLLVNSCGQAAFENVNFKAEKDNLTVVTKIYGQSFESPENQKIIAAAIKDISKRLNSNEISITNEIKHVRVRVIWFANKAASVGDLKNGKRQSAVFIQTERIKSLHQMSSELKPLSLVEGIIFGKEIGSEKSATSFCADAKNRKNSGAYCGFVANPIPRHRYTSKDGKFYLYGAEVSEEEAKKGKGAGETMAFEYLGLKNGEHKVRLENYDDSYTCSNPCESIKHVFQGRVLDRTTFDTSSVIGAVFQDAIGGELEVAKPSTKK